MKKSVLVLLIMVTMVCLSHYGCKTSDTGTFVLTVKKNENVDGFPEAGTHAYDMNSRVPYNYSTSRLYTNAKALLDSIEIPMQGTITMDRDHTLTIGCDRIDFSGKWTVDYVWAYFDCSIPDVGESEEITIVQAGDAITIAIFSGTITLTGNMYGDGEFRCLFEETGADGFTMTYTISGQFLSPDVFEGEFIIFGHFGNSNWHSCWSKAVIAGTKNQ